MEKRVCFQRGLQYFKMYLCSSPGFSFPLARRQQGEPQGDLLGAPVSSERRPCRNAQQENTRNSREMGTNWICIHINAHMHTANHKCPPLFPIPLHYSHHKEKYETQLFIQYFQEFNRVYRLNSEGQTLVSGTPSETPLRMEFGSDSDSKWKIIFHF